MIMLELPSDSLHVPRLFHVGRSLHRRHRHHKQCRMAVKEEKSPRLSQCVVWCGGSLMARGVSALNRTGASGDIPLIGLPCQCALRRV